MNRNHIALAGGAAAVVLVALVLAIAGGVGPFGAGSDGLEEFPTATPTPDDPGDGETATGGSAGAGDAGGGDATTEERAPQRPFALEVESIEECGRTCRDVTATLLNQQDRRATGVTVYTRIYAGRDADGDVVWEGNHEVGTLGDGDSDTETQRVQLSYFEALSIQREDGWVTIVTTIQSDRHTVTFRERRDVA